MVVLVVDSNIRTVLQLAGLESEIISHEDGAETVSHRVVLESIRLSGSVCSLRSLLQGKVLHASHEDAAKVHCRPPERNPELEARLARIRTENENREYARMVRDVVRLPSRNAEAESARLGRLGAQMSIGANVIITMATCFVAGYFVFKHSSGRESVGLIGGCAGMIMAMLVEVVLVITRMYSIHDAEEKERSVVSRRVGGFKSQE